MIRINKKLITKIIIILTLFLAIYPNYYSLENSINPNNDEKISLQSPFTLMFNETFNCSTYMNQSITNSSGWGEDFLFLPNQ
ncbi:MAG: hypothetical protein ACFFG0_46120, partial [Candidatus Thorarchaeota archaeon]